MKKNSSMRIIAVGTFALIASSALADQPSGVNVTAGDYFDIDQPFIGVGYQMPVSPRWSIEPNAEYVFMDTGHLYTFNVDSRYQLDPSAANPMYVGAGLGVIQHRQPFSDQTDSAVNLMWGVDFNGYRGSLTPFVNTKAVFSDKSDFAVSFGVRFGGATSSGPRTAQNAPRASETGS